MAEKKGMCVLHRVLLLNGRIIFTYLSYPVSKRGEHCLLIGSALRQE